MVFQIKSQDKNTEVMSDVWDYKNMFTYTDLSK